MATLTKSAIIKKLDSLQDLMAKVEEAEKSRNMYLESIIPKDVLDVLKAMDDEVKSLKEKVVDKEAEVKNCIVEFGESVAGEKLNGVFVSAKTTWDGEKLEALVAICPDIAFAKKTGNPFAQIRAKGLKK